MRGFLAGSNVGSGVYVQRCAMAMRETGSCDWYKLARVGLEAAIATEAELIAILDPPKPARDTAATALLSA